MLVDMCSMKLVFPWMRGIKSLVVFLSPLTSHIVVPPVIPIVIPATSSISSTPGECIVSLVLSVDSISYSSIDFLHFVDSTPNGGDIFNSSSADTYPKCLCANR